MFVKMFASWSGTKLKVFLLIIFLVLMLATCVTTPPLPPAPPKPATIAVVLGAGASKGFAHIGY